MSIRDDNSGTGEYVEQRVPEERVLFTGDLVFHRVTSMIATGSLEGALRSLDWLAAFEPAVVVPGHGPIVPGADGVDGVDVNIAAALGDAIACNGGPLACSV